MSLSFLQLCSQSPPQHGPGIFYALRQDPIKKKYVIMSLVSVSQEKIRETFVKNGPEVNRPALGVKRWTGVPTWLLEIPSRPVFHSHTCQN